MTQAHREQHDIHARQTVGRGEGIAALFNGRAKQVTPAVVRLFSKALPEALVLVSEDLEQSQRHVERIIESKPAVVFSGGGDGAAMRMLNLMRAELSPEEPFPTFGVLRLGTGNAWARAVGAPRYPKLVEALPQLPWPLPARRFDLVEVEEVICQFGGVGWDARIVNDYQRNLDRRSGQLFGSSLATRLHKGLTGYLYSTARYTVPELMAELRLGPRTMRLEKVDGQDAFRLDSSGAPVRHPNDLLYDGAVSVAAAATCREWGFGFRAFPFADKLPGYINIRIYDRPVTEAVLNSLRLWAGAHPMPGMHDFFVKRARMVFGRPMPFQIGGDAHGARSEVEFGLADRSIQVVHWGAAV